MSKIGYARISSKTQNIDRQLKALNEAGCEKIYQDKLSGKDTNRPGLQDMLSHLRDTDTVIVASLDRLSRDYNDIKSILNQITTTTGATFQALDMPAMNTGNKSLDSAVLDMMIAMMSFVAQNEREKIKERQSQGIKLAKERGVYTGKQPIYTSESRTVINIIKDFNDGTSKARLAKEYGISRTTVYKILRDNNIIEQPNK